MSQCHKLKTIHNIRDGNCTPMGVYAPQAAMLYDPPRSLYAPTVFALFFGFCRFCAFREPYFHFVGEEFCPLTNVFAPPSLFNLTGKRAHSSQLLSIDQPNQPSWFFTERSANYRKGPNFFAKQRKGSQITTKQRKLPQINASTVPPPSLQSLPPPPPQRCSTF